MLSSNATDPKMKLFGVMLTTLVVMGALVGGVVGVLLPKISTGISLGVLISLFLGVVRSLAILSICLINLA
jgi:F0F1-type ATP synthase assembly protein I